MTEPIHPPEQSSPQGLDRYEQVALQLDSQQNLLLGFIGGTVAAIIGAILWAAITVSTGWQIGFMAIGVGFLVGYAVSYLGKGITPKFGFMGAALALFGCLFGNYLTIIGEIANYLEMGYYETFENVPVAVVKEFMVESFSIIDLLFYAIAIYQGYQLSFTDLTAED